MGLASYEIVSNEYTCNNDFKPHFCKMKIFVKRNIHFKLRHSHYFLILLYILILLTIHSVLSLTALLQPECQMESRVTSTKCAGLMRASFGGRAAPIYAVAV
jgi:hypothetical protein